MPPPEEAPWPAVRLRLTGIPTGGGHAAAALERKDAALLALLALDGAQSRDRLAAWLWPESSPKAAGGSLRQRLFRLRRRFEHALVSTGERIELLPGVHIDADDSAGELLSGCDYADCPEVATWLAAQREQRSAHRADRHAAAAARHEAAGEWVAALAELRALVALQPLSEHAGRWLMRLHYLRGDRAAALDAFEQLEQRLRHDIGTRPGAETLALLATIEQAAPLAVTGLAPRGVPASLRRPPRLVGREREFSALQRAWAADRVFLVVGEAGMGKTRLLAELAAARGPRCLHVAARPGDGGVPYALLARLLRALRACCSAAADDTTRRALARVLPELDATPLQAGEGQRLLLQRAVQWQLGAAAAQGSDELLIDDLHFADAASLDMLQALLQSDLPLRWGLARRPGEAGAALHEALAEAQRLHEESLAPLDQTAVRALVASLGVPGLDADALAGPLLRHTGGNPLFALETLKDHLIAGAPASGLPQPASVGALIERRLRALSPGAMALARVAAIAGIDFGIDLAEAVLRRPALDLADDWRELQVAQVLAGAAFAHDLVADAALRTVPDEIARHVHAAVAAWLQERGSEPARRAAHWQAAGRHPEAGTAFEQAAVRARAAGRMVDALALRRRAAAAWQAAGDTHESWHCEARAVETCLFVEGVDAAMALAERLGTDAHDDGQRIAAAEAVGLVHLMAGRAAEAEAVVLPALALAERLGQPERALDALRQWGLARSQRGHAAEAVQRLQAAAPHFEACGTLRQRYEFRATLAYALNDAGAMPACKAALREALTLAREAGDLAEVGSSLMNLAVAESATGHAADALQLARDAAALQRQNGTESGPHARVLDMNLGSLAAATGDFQRALALLEAAPTQLAPLGAMWVCNAENHLAALWLTLGQWARAERLLHEPIDAAAMPAVRMRREQLRACLARWRGTPDAAAVQSLLHGAAAPAAGSHARALFGLRIELSHALPTSEARLLMQQLQREATACGQQGFALHALLRELQLAVTEDGPEVRSEGEVPALLAALDAVDDRVFPSAGYRPEPWLASAQAHAAAGRLDTARRQAARARAWIDRCAAEQVPAGLRRVFLEAHPVHAALRALEAHLGPRLGPQTAGR